MTGETIPSEKEANIILKNETTMGDMKNMAFATTIVVNGRGIAVCTNTGMNTKVGKIAGMIIEDENSETSKEIRRSRKNSCNSMYGNLCINICNRNI